jgi:hypothetical protein
VTQFYILTREKVLIYKNKVGSQFLVILEGKKRELRGDKNAFHFTVHQSTGYGSHQFLHKTVIQITPVPNQLLAYEYGLV